MDRPLSSKIQSLPLSTWMLCSPNIGTYLGATVKARTFVCPFSFSGGEDQPVRYCCIAHLGSRAENCTLISLIKCSSRFFWEIFPWKQGISTGAEIHHRGACLPPWSGTEVSSVNKRSNPRFLCRWFLWGLETSLQSPKWCFPSAHGQCVLLQWE